MSVLTANAWTVSLAVLAQITVVLTAALAAAWILRRFPAARHEALYWALAACGIGPAAIAAAHLRGISPSVLERYGLASPAISAVDGPIVAAVARAAEARDSRASAGAGMSPVVFLLGLWAEGTVVMLVRIGLGMRFVWGLGRGAVEMEPDRRLRGIFGGRVPRILASERVSMPVAVGFWRPVVVLPMGLAEKLERDQLMQVMVHESAYALRRDPLMGLYQRLIGAVFWFHPLVHLSKSRGAEAAGYAEQKCQWMTVHKGEGEFTLIFPMNAEGSPHLSFYDEKSSFGGVYFGTGDSVLTKWWGK